MAVEHPPAPLDSLPLDDPYAAIARSRPHLFSPARVTVSAEQATAMARIVAAVEAVVGLPGYRHKVLGWGPAIARHEPGAAGVFYGFDFHLTADGPRLIEINTNAGGALLHALQAGAATLSMAEDVFFAMFADEWRRQRRERALSTVAIVDDQPGAQYLQPEFVLFQRMFERRGLTAMVLDPSALSWRDGALWHGGRRIDLVYNRLTDFDLSEPGHEALRQAYLADAAVVTPHPTGHALYADKRNLAVLADHEALTAWGLEREDAALLAAAIPPTIPVAPDYAEALWRNRRRFFFKPVDGYGSKGAYRGDKLTTRVWGEILQRRYVAQEYAAPKEQLVMVGGREVSLKCDVRNYAYRGQVQLLAARLYQGQTTNFRTPGGGFAPVEVVPTDRTAAAGPQNLPVSTSSTTVGVT